MNKDSLWKIKDFFGLIEWGHVSYTENSAGITWFYNGKKVPEFIIEKHIDDLNWVRFSRENPSEFFINKYAGRIDCWQRIFKRYTLSEQFIEKYITRLSWTQISIYQKLSEPFIEKYQNKVYWPSIYAKQDISKRFAKKYLIKINSDIYSQYLERKLCTS